MCYLELNSCRARRLSSQCFSGLGPRCLICYSAALVGTNWYWVSLRAGVYWVGFSWLCWLSSGAGLRTWWFANPTSVAEIREVESWGYCMCYDGLLCAIFIRLGLVWIFGFHGWFLLFDTFPRLYRLWPLEGKLNCGALLCWILL